MLRVFDDIFQLKVGAVMPAAISFLTSTHINFATHPT